MTAVKALGYIGCDVTDHGAWDNLLAQVYGLELRRDSGKSVRQYRLDDQHHRLALHKGTKDQLRYVGWEMATQADLDRIAADLSARGVDVAAGSAALKTERAVMDLVTVTGPDQVPVELFFGPLQDFHPFSPRRGMDGYKTGDLGMGHLVLASADREAAVRWYQEMLGFRLSDHIFWEGVEASFLHCNPRHHSIAFMNTIGDMHGGDLGHFMFEGLSLNDVGRAYDLVSENEVPLALTLGRHTNDQMTSFYVYTPSGWWLEYGYGGRLIDDADWEPKFYNSPKIWGHEMLPPPAAGEKPIHKR